MLDPRLRSLKGKPIDGTVGTSPLASCYNTRLETRGGDVFHPNKHRVMNLRRIVSVIHRCKNANRRQRVWKTSTEGGVLTLVSLAGCHLHHKFPLFDSWKQHFVLVSLRFNEQIAEGIRRSCSFDCQFTHYEKLPQFGSSWFAEKIWEKKDPDHVLSLISYLFSVRFVNKLKEKQLNNNAAMRCNSQKSKWKGN